VKRKRKRKSGLLARFREGRDRISFYRDGKYRYDNWAANEYSRWKIQDDIISYKHKGDHWYEMEDCAEWVVKLKAIIVEKAIFK